MGSGWHYANSLLPMKIGESEAMEMIGRSSRKHVEKSYLWGSPKKVAAEIQAFVDAGVTLVGILDVMPMLLEPEESAAAISRSLEISKILKQG